jgi:uncharacterized phiE125 gp8 family phage protein
VALSLVTAPSGEPVSLAEARQQLRLSDSASDENDLITGLIAAARERAEAVTGRQLVTATWDHRLDEVCEDAIVLPKPPLQTVVSVTYIDSAGATQTWSAAEYQVDAPSGPYARKGRLAPLPSATWPIAQSGRFNAITVRFTAGYGAAVNVPHVIRQAMLLMIGGWFENREDMVSGGLASIPLGALALLTPYKVHG